MAGSKRLIFLILTAVWCHAYAATSVVIQRTMPIPLRSYKDPRSVVYGRLTIPEFTVSAKLHIFVGSSPTCDPPGVLWSIAHERFPYLNFRNGSRPASVRVIPNEIELTMAPGTHQQVVLLNFPAFGDWFWAVVLNQSYVEKMGLEKHRRCAHKAMMAQFSGVEDTPPLINSDGQPFQVALNASVSALHRFQPPPGALSVRLELLSCQRGNVTVDVASCPVVANFSRNRMPPEAELKSPKVPFLSSGLNTTVRPVRPDTRNFFRLTNLDPAKRPVRLTLRLAAVQSCALAPLLPDIVPPQPEGCVLLPEMNRFYDFMTRFQYYFTYHEDDMDEGPWMTLNIASNRYITAFRIRSGEDQGGTLQVAVKALPMDAQGTEATEVRVSACLSDIPVLALPEDHCLLRLSASSRPSAPSELPASVFLPYPGRGMLYLVLWRDCFLEAKPVECSNASRVQLRASSRPCLNGSCGQYGACTLVTSRDIQLSACKCKWGYGGFGCTDDRYAISMARELAALLLLTLSNVFFVPAVVMAVRRRYFVQALVYGYTMLSSTVYHLCDSSTPYSTCLLNYNVLSFCDFYGAIMSIWVTLIAMAKLPRGVAELACMSAALGLVIGVVSDRHSLYTFLVPLVIGLTLVLLSWVRQWCLYRKCYPRRQWWLAGFLPGVVLAACGMVLFGFFETAANYAYIHSLWHVFISLSIVFLLPWTPAPPLLQRGAGLSFSAVRQSELHGGYESPLDDGERVIMDSNVLPVDSDWIYGQNEYDRLLQP